MGDKYIDELDQIWEMIEEGDMFVLRRVDDGFIEFFEDLAGFDLLTDQLW